MNEFPTQMFGGQSDGLPLRKRSPHVVGMQKAEAENWSETRKETKGTMEDCLTFCSVKPQTRYYKREKDSDVPSSGKSRHKGPAVCGRVLALKDGCVPRRIMLLILCSRTQLMI